LTVKGAKRFQKTGCHSIFWFFPNTWLSGHATSLQSSRWFLRRLGPEILDGAIAVEKAFAKLAAPA
jgi:hypothetical protein